MKQKNRDALDALAIDLDLALDMVRQGKGDPLAIIEGVADDLHGLAEGRIEATSIFSREAS